MSTMFASMLAWLIGGLLLPLTAILRLVGLLLPACSTLGVLSVPDEVLNSLAQWIRFLWPFLQFIPWSDLWNLVAAILLYGFFKFVWGHRSMVLSLGPKFIVIVICIYVIAAFITIFTGSAWMDSPVFTEIFGESPTSTGEVGGLGGGGGSTW